MRPSTTLKITGLMTGLLSLVLIPVYLVAWLNDEGIANEYIKMFIVIAGLSYVVWHLNRRASSQVKHANSFIIVSLIWLLFGFVGAIPFHWILGISWCDGFFESMSGLTTAGATVLSGLDDMQHSILLYRQLLQWLGGMGIIVLFVALFPALNIGGLHLFKAEIPGPVKDEKLTPRLVHTAQYLWGIYVSITALCTLAYAAAGMTWFDAICHALTTISTGGFSTHDASLGYWDSPLIEGIAIVFMFIGAINFSLHFGLFRRFSFRQYYRDSESIWFLGIIIGATVLITMTLVNHHYYPDTLTALRYAGFEVVSFITSTGYGTVDYSEWPTFLPLFLILISFAGGCAGSTAGGMKIVRVMFIWKGIAREMTRISHPTAMVQLKHNHTIIEDTTANTILAFMFFYAFTALVFTLLLMACGLDMISAFGAVAASLNVSGPGLGEVVSSFASVSDGAKWLSSLAMVIGRLEIFTLLVLLHPGYWRELNPLRQRVHQW